jgi:DNA ligase (NAD+)
MEDKIINKILKHDHELEELKKLGFAVNPLNQVCDNLDDVWEVYTELDKNRESLNYPIDGLVVKLNDNNLVEKLGIIGKTPRAWSAIKFAPDEVTTRIISLDFQIGRSGKLTPVANLEPVLLQGSIVKRATLHNIKEVLDYNLHELDTIIIRKAGDIIPEILSVLPNFRVPNSQLFDIPSICPSCSSKLVYSKTNVDLFCLNSSKCIDQIKQRLSYYSSRGIANIDGLSDKTLEKLILEFDISDISDLYNLDFKAIAKLEGFGIKSSESLLKSIDKARCVEDYKFIAGLGIEGIGISGAKLIASAISEHN